MNVIRPVITSLLLVYVRIRIINTIFSQKKIKINLTLKIFGLAIIIVGSLFAYTYLLWYIWQQELALTNIISTQSVWIFIAYCTIFAIIITLLFRSRQKKIAQILLIWSLFFIALAYGGLLTGINVLILYYLISAYAEEYMKYSAGNNLFLADKEPNPSNLIFFCIVVGLWFGAVENILYIINNLLTNESVNIINLLIGRGLVSTLIHIVATSLIAFITIKMQKSNRVAMPLILGVIWWVWLHSIYNISLQYSINYITIPLIILAFFLLTYMTFQSDIIYRSKKN